MRRRDFIAGLGVGVLWPLVASADPPIVVPLVGFLNSQSARDYQRQLAAFRDALAEAGYVDGRNVKIEYRWADNHFDRLEEFDKPLFRNRRNQRLSRSGIRYILQQYLGSARSKYPNLKRRVSPHTLLHSKGMHLLQSGISLDMIRDFLGHVDVKTTQIYARANLEMKRKALEKVSEPSPIPSIPTWQQNKNLLDWLRSL